MYVVDQQRGKVAVTDGTSLSGLKGEVQSLAEPVGSSVVDGAGRLWTLGAGTGDLVWFDGTERHARRAVAEDPRDTELVVIDGQPALVDRATRLVRTVGDDGGLPGPVRAWTSTRRTARCGWRARTRPGGCWWCRATTACCG